MGQSLDADASFGFVLDRYLDIEELPQSITDAFTEEEVATITYGTVGHIDGGDYLEAVIKKKYPLLDMSYPGNEYCEELIVHVKSNSVNAYYGAAPLSLVPPTEDEERQINELASLMNHTPQWYLYPRHG